MILQIVVDTYNNALFSLKKGAKAAIWDSIDEPWEHYAK